MQNTGKSASGNAGKSWRDPALLSDAGRFSTFPCIIFPCGTDYIPGNGNFICRAIRSRKEYAGRALENISWCRDCLQRPDTSAETERKLVQLRLSDRWLHAGSKWGNPSGRMHRSGGKVTGWDKQSKKTGQCKGSSTSDAAACDRSVERPCKKSGGRKFVSFTGRNTSLSTDCHDGRAGSRMSGKNAGNRSYMEYKIRKERIRGDKCYERNDQQTFMDTGRE